jgi:hypothetical protein
MQRRDPEPGRGQHSAPPRADAYFPGPAAGATENVPPATPFAVMRVHEQRRRARLMRILSLGVLGPAILLIPSALIPTLDRVTLLAIGIAIAASVLAFLINQRGGTSAAGFMLLGGIALAIAWEILGKVQAQHGIDLSDLRLFDLFALPIVLSGVVVGRRGPLAIASATILFTIGSLLVLPHTPPLQEYWGGTYRYAILGSVYDVIAVAVVLQVLMAIASWLGADSVRRALLDASRAEDLASANEQIQTQATQLELQRRRLQDGIAHIQQVHAAVARGRWDARATIAEGELLPVAMSLNLLLDRLSRMVHEHDQQARIETAAHELAVALRRVRAGEPYTPPAYTGTAFDEVLVEFATLRGMPGAPGSGFATGGPLLRGEPTSRPGATGWPELPPTGWPEPPAPGAGPQSGPNPSDELPFWLGGSR